MMRVISSPSSSTTGFFTLIFAIAAVLPLACRMSGAALGGEGALINRTARHPGESRDLRPESHSGSPRGPGFRRGDVRGDGCHASRPSLKAAPMTSLEKPDLVTTNVRYRMPNVHPEG